MLFMLVSCSGFNDSSSGGESAVGELSLGRTLSGTISSTGEVDWYHFRAVEANNVLQIRCTSETLRPDVDLLVTVFQEDGDGNKVRLYADHAPDGGISPADITLNVYIEQPKDIYISVRDLMDDDCSDSPYYLSIDFGSSAEGNENFTQATPLTVDSDSCPTDSIGYVGDIDCYSFTVAEGIYDLNVDFTPFPDTRVQLSVDLYDSEGNLIESQSRSDALSYHLIHYLSAGEYYVHIDDYGRDDFDNASSYEICVKSIDSAEGNENDSAANATVVHASGYDQDYPVSGSLDYSEDRDWYRISMPAAADGFRVLQLVFAAGTNYQYQVNIADADQTTLMSHTYRGGGSEYQTQIKLEDGDCCYLMIRLLEGQVMSQSGPYSATVRVLNIVDNAEVDPNDNDTIDTADPLLPTSDPGSATSGKIGYRGDVDWYTINISPHAQPQVLEVFLAAPISQVEYALSVIGQELEKKIYNSDAESVPTKLQTGILIPANDEAAVYSFKVGDFQDDDGDDASYTIRVDLKDIPASLPAVADGTPPAGSTVEYYSEVSETDATAITLEYNSVTRKEFGVNTGLLDFANADIEEDVPESGLTRVSFPWIAGYMDYQGDQDWFQIDFDPLDDSDEWYYEIRVDFYAPASDVEYVWKFYPDRNDNQILADRSSGYDGFIASAGDLNTDEQTVDVTTPAVGDDPFWVGHSWQGPAYFSISDFDYLRDPDGNENPQPDDDWGGYDEAPYYFKLTLVYHPGESHP
jgi:hypothetical protein